MKDTLRQLPLPVLLLLCLVLGGSAQSVWGLLILQILAIAIIAWAVISSSESVTSSGRGLLLLLLGGLILIGLQLVPLPPGVWSSLPARDLVEDGYRAFDQHPAWQPISLEPYATLGTLLFLLPPTAVVVSVLGLRAYQQAWVAAALFTGTMTGILLGYVQVITGQFGHSAWYLYEHTNVGSAVGFFANRNHMGTLLLMTFPFVVALTFPHEEVRPAHATSRRIIGSAGVAAILLGLAANGSLAAVALAVPVIAASAVLVPGMRKVRNVILSATAIALLGALIYLASSPVQPKLTGESTTSFTGRWELWEGTGTLLRNSFPIGTGLGTFEQVYAAGEPAEKVTGVYANHAHNDYLQLLLEAGLPGALLMLAFFVWWTRQAARALNTPLEKPFAAAATIASGVALAHSVVDYPLRTTAVAAVFAFCVAVMAAGRQAQPIGKATSGAGDPPPRHVRIG